MALPVLNNPTYKMELPSTGEKIKYRPFLGKGTKGIDDAIESDDTWSNPKQSLTSLNHVHSVNLNKVDKLPTYDIEYMFVQSRAKICW